MLKKKTFSLVMLLIASILILGIASQPSFMFVYGAADSLYSPYVSVEQANEEAAALNKLGLFLGTGNGFALEEVPTRLQGLVMLVRILGEEDKAKACDYTHPFRDVPAWGDRYVAWAYNRGYTNGTSKTTFTPNAPITAQQYLAFILRAMNYADEVTYQSTIADAHRLGIIPSNEYNDLKATFVRADIVHITYSALRATEKTSGKPFYICLIAKGAVDEDIAKSIFEAESYPNKDSDIYKKLVGGDDENSDDNESSVGDENNIIGKPNTPEKYYTYTNTHNDKSSYKVSIDENKITVSGYDYENKYMEVILYEVKSVEANGLYDKEPVVSEYVFFTGDTFCKSIDIPDLQYGNGFELAVETFNENSFTQAICKIWIKGQKNAWYFEGPAKLALNDLLTKVANAISIDYWIGLRKNATDEDFKNQIISLMGNKASSDYETAYNVMTWLSQNIDGRENAEYINSKDVLKYRVTTCEGYANLMSDALAIYGIPARIVEGEILYGTGWCTFDSKLSAMNHAWVEFYDSDSGRWVICNPAYTAAPSCWFDLDREFVANGMKIVRFR